MDTPRIRHIAICTKDPAGTAAFYEAAAHFNVDGGASFVGIHHMGFMVEDTDQMLDYLQQSMEVEPINKRAPKASEGSHFEAKIRDPNGIVIDIARAWPGLEAAHAT